jgi:tetratricopeptide (TPR) repeat protein
VLAAQGRAYPELLAVHLHGAGQPARAVKYYLQAGTQAAETLAFERAAALYERALQLQPAGDQGMRDLRVHWADALANAGRGTAAASAYLEAAAGADGVERLELQRRAALQFLSAGHVDDGLATLRTVLDAAGLTMPSSPARALGRLLWERLRLRLRGLKYRPRALAEVPPDDLRNLDACLTAGLGLSMVDTIQGAYFQARSLSLALRAGEPQRLTRALAMEAAHESIGGSHSRQRTARLLTLAEDAATQAGGVYARALVTMARGIAAALAGDWREAVAIGDRAEALLRESCIGVGWDLGTVYRFALWPLMFMGEVAEMARRLPRLLREARERDDLYTVTNLTLAVGTFVCLAQDDPQGARAELEQVMQRWSRRGFHVQHMNRLHDEAQIDLYLGQSLAAWQRLTGHWDQVRRTHLLRVQQVRVFLLHLRGRCALAVAASGHNTLDMLRRARRDAQALAREGAAWARALAVLLEAGLAWGKGDRQKAAGLFAQAVERLEAVDMRLYAAAARHCQGQLIGGTQGHKMASGAEEWMKGQGVQNIERMTSLLTPPFTIT